MKFLAKFIVNNFLLCALFLFILTKAYVLYVMSEHQMDMMVKYAQSSDHPTPEQSAINALALGVMMVN